MNNPIPPSAADQLQQAERALIQGDFSTCAALADQVLQRDAISVPGHLFRGVASHHLNELDRSISDLLFVLERQPENSQASFHLGLALRKNQQFDTALSRFQAALDVPSLRMHALFEMARCLRGLGKLDKAIDHYQLLLRENPKHADAAANLAMLLEKTNSLDEALAWAERAVVMAPRNVAAQLTAARVQRRQGRFKEAAASLQKLLEQQLPPLTQVIATNQLAQCLDRMGDYDEAFEQFGYANDLQWDNDPDADIDHRACYGKDMAVFLRDWLTEHPPEDWSPTPEDDREPPVFLLGFPRSGTTLLDQVLSAHPHIGVIEEQELFLDIRRRWMSTEGFPGFPQMSPEDIQEARRIYRSARAAAYRDPDAQVVVDKLPLNSMYLQLIYRLFPNARIIFAVRDPRDVVLSCFFQTFRLVGAMPYFLEMDSTVAYYDAVMNLAMDSKEALPLAVETVRYEDVVDDLETEARKLVEFLGLSWNDEVLNYREQQAGRVIDTPSYQQVSEPLYRRSVGRWKNYQKQMDEYLPVLNPWAERLGYDAD